MNDASNIPVRMDMSAKWVGGKLDDSDPKR